MAIGLPRRVIACGALVASGIGLLSSSPALARGHHGHGGHHHKTCGVQVQVDPEKREVTSTDTASPVSFAAQVSVRKGWRGTVDLSVRGVPHSGTSTLTPQHLSFNRANTTQTADVSVSLGTDPRARPYRLWVVARCGKESAVDGFQVVVNKAGGVTEEQALGIDPEEASVRPGDQAEYCVTGAKSPGQLEVSGLPPHTSKSFSRKGGHQDDCITLTVRTHTDTPIGDYPLTISTKGHQGPPSSVTAVLHVIGDSQPFSISGDLAAPLEIGVPQPLDLAFTNHNATQLTLTNVSVTIDHLDAAHAAGCSIPDNFAVTQFSGPYEQVVMQPNATTSLSDTGIPSQYWPQIEFLNTDFDQSACLGATLSLAYTGTATG